MHLDTFCLGNKNIKVCILCESDVSCTLADYDNSEVAFKITWNLITSLETGVCIQTNIFIHFCSQEAFFSKNDTKPHYSIVL